MKKIGLCIFILGFTLNVQGINLQAHWLSDYSFRGISQTKGTPAYHFKFQFKPLPPIPIYAASELYRVYKIDEQDESSYQINYHLGFKYAIDEQFSADLGSTWYNYYGHNDKIGTSRSRERNYNEGYLGFVFKQNTSLYVNYSDDTLGSTNARNIAFEFRHAFPALYTSEFYFGRVNSLDKDKLLWDDDERYRYYGFTLKRNFNKWITSITFENTSINTRLARQLRDRGERKWIFAIGYQTD